MRKFYIAPGLSIRSGISAYSAKFYRHVLEPTGVERLNASSIEEFDRWVDLNGTAHHFHIELGVGTHLERLILRRLISKGAYVDITLHDPPYIEFPYYRFNHRWINQVAKLAQIMLPQYFFGGSVVDAISTVYTLSETGRSKTAKTYPRASVRALPFLSISEDDHCLSYSRMPSLVYTGFIARNKGLEYALEIHANLRKQIPELHMTVVGEPVDRVSSLYLEDLKSRFSKNVSYLGYVDAKVLNSILSVGNIVLLPTKDYRTICPVSANVIDALAKGSVVVTTTANANPELISHGENGFFLTFDKSIDQELIAKLVQDIYLRQSIIAKARLRLERFHGAEEVRVLLRS